MSVARRLLDLSPPSRLALLAIAGGLGALAIGEPASSSRVVLDTRELASMVQSEVDHVSPEELADWIIRGREDFRLVDLRSDVHVALHGEGPAACRSDLLGDGCALGERPAGDGDGGTLTTEHERRAAPDAGTASGDDGNCTIQTTHRSLLG